MSMTIQQAIENRERCYKYLIGCGPKATTENVEAVRLSLEALREKAEREDPKPLTIEELRQMNGLPVWVEELSQRIDNTGWALVEVDDRGTWKGVPFVKCHVCTWNVIFRNLHCYRHKPKEVQG